MIVSRRWNRPLLRGLATRGETHPVSSATRTSGFYLFHGQNDLPIQFLLVPLFRQSLADLVCQPQEALSPFLSRLRRQQGNVLRRQGDLGLRAHRGYYAPQLAFCSTVSSADSGRQSPQINRWIG